MADQKDETLKTLRKYGKCVRIYSSKKEPGLYTAVCPGCGKEIQSTGDLEKVEFSVTKRQTACFFHTKCFPKVFDSKIV